MSSKSVRIKAHLNGGPNNDETVEWESGVPWYEGEIRVPHHVPLRLMDPEDYNLPGFTIGIYKPRRNPDGSFVSWRLGTYEFDWDRD